MHQLTFFAEEPHANPSASPDLEKDWMIRVATSCSPLVPLLHATAPAGWYGKTSPVSCHQIKDGILEPSSQVWQNAGMGSPTAFLTLNTSECHSAAAASSLSDVLETGAVPQRHFLSAKACAGILHRAQRRGKVLPPSLEAALRSVSGDSVTMWRITPCQL